MQIQNIKQNLLLLNKKIRTWTNSTFASSDYIGRNPINKNVFNKYMSQEENDFIYYKIYTDAYWIILLIGMILAVIYKQNTDSTVFISKQVLIFYIIFLTIWECNSRYIVNILPIIILISGYGWYNLLNKFKKMIYNNIKK